MAIFNISNDGIHEVSESSFHANGILEITHLQNYFRDKIQILCPNTLMVK